MLPVLNRGRCCFPVVFYSTLSFMHLAGFYSKHLTHESGLYTKTIHLKFIPIPTIDFISSHLIQVCISQAMNAKKNIYTGSECQTFH